MKRVRFLATMELMAVLALGFSVLAQTTSQDAQKPGANAWMLTPTPYLEWNKDISPSLRAERDAFWDSLSHRELPLTAKAQRGGAFGGPDWFDDGTEPEIPDVPDRAILIATFATHRSVLSASEKSIYTEITMRVQQVFEDRTASGSLAPHKNVTLMLIGGTVALRSGRVLSDHVQPSEPLFDPQRSYS